MRLLVVGAGSTGGYFGGRLAQAGRDVTFLVRPRRAAQLRESGLQIVSPHGNVTVRPKLVTAGEIEAPYDAVLLGVKAYSLEAAIDDFAAAVGPETTIIPTLNGMRHIDILEERFGKEPVAGGVCKVAATIDPDGRIVQLAQFQELAYGERDGSVSQRMERLHAFMQGAGFDARLSRSIEYEMWEKWTMLATLGGITCLMRGNIGEVVATEEGRTLMIEALAECQAVAAASGHAPRPQSRERVQAMLTEPGSINSASMRQDLEAGRRTEADAIVGDMLRRAHSFGISTPLLRAAWCHLQVHENGRKAA